MKGQRLVVKARTCVHACITVLPTPQPCLSRQVLCYANSRDRSALAGRKKGGWLPERTSNGAKPSQGVATREAGLPA